VTGRVRRTINRWRRVAHAAPSVEACDQAMAQCLADLVALGVAPAQLAEIALTLTRDALLDRSLDDQTTQRFTDAVCQAFGVVVTVTHPRSTGGTP